MTTTRRAFAYSRNDDAKYPGELQCDNQSKKDAFIRIRNHFARPSFPGSSTDTLFGLFKPEAQAKDCREFLRLRFRLKWPVFRRSELCANNALTSRDSPNP